MSRILRLRRFHKSISWAVRIPSRLKPVCFPGLRRRGWKPRPFKAIYVSSALRTRLVCTPVESDALSAMLSSLR